MRLLHPKKIKASILILAIIMPQIALINTTSRSLALNSSELVLFEDDYENNTPRILQYLDNPPFGWTFNDVEDPNGAYMELVNDSNEAYRGDFCLKHYAPRSIWIDPEENPYGIENGYWSPTYCLALKHVESNMSEIYLRWYEKFDNLPSSNWEKLTIAYFFQISTYVESMEASIIMIDNQTNLQFSKLWGAGKPDTDYGTRTVPINITTNQWYCFEMWYKSDPVDGEYKAWFEGQKVLEIGNRNTVPRGERAFLPDSVDLGILNFEKEKQYIAWTDCVVIATTRIGPIEWNPPIIDLAIQVLDRQTGSSISEAEVQLGPYKLYTNKTGYATFKNIVAYRQYPATISKYGYQTYLEDLKIFDSNMEIYLESIPTGKGALKVIAFYGEEKVPALVNISDISHSTPFTVVLKPGVYNLSVYYEREYFSVEMIKNVTIEEKRTTITRINFPIKNGTFEISVFSGSAEIICSVYIADEKGLITLIRSPSSVELKPGLYTLTVIYDNQTLVKTKTLLDGQTILVDFVFKFEGLMGFGILIRNVIITLLISGAILIGIDILRLINSGYNKKKKLA